jgi:hypothetical protein
LTLNVVGGCNLDRIELHLNPSSKRGELRKRCGTKSAPEAADPLPPIGRCYADFAQNREAVANQSRAAAFDQGMPSNPHPDSCAPTPDSQSGDSIEIIELPRNAIPRIPRKQWRELIQKVWEVDPFICPICARPMHINGILEDRNAASALLKTLGWFTYATDSQCARAPPHHSIDPDASELPFCRDLDGFVYVPEPWELARQLRLQRHAQQRDQLAGIVIYDGDCNATSDVPGDADPGPATATKCRRPALEHPCPVFPEEFDQSSWDPCAQQWQDTPLAKWEKSAAQVNRATEITVWDNIDAIPPEDEPVFPQEDEPVFFTD